MMFAFIAFASKEESDIPGLMYSLTRAFVVQAHLRPFRGTYENSADPDQTPQNVASD